jgi:hypothetical protein
VRELDLQLSVRRVLEEDGHLAGLGDELLAKLLRPVVLL